MLKSTSPFAEYGYWVGSTTGRALRSGRRLRTVGACGWTRSGRPARGCARRFGRAVGAASGSGTGFTWARRAAVQYPAPPRSLSDSETWARLTGSARAADAASTWATKTRINAAGPIDAR